MTFYTFTTTIFATSTREKVCGGVKNVYPKHHEALPGPSLLNRDQMWELEEGVTFCFHYMYIYIIIYIILYIYIYILLYFLAAVCWCSYNLLVAFEVYRGSTVFKAPSAQWNHKSSRGQTLVQHFFGDHLIQVIWSELKKWSWNTDSWDKTGLSQDGATSVSSADMSAQQCFGWRNHCYFDKFRSQLDLVVKEGWLSVDCQLTYLSHLIQSSGEENRACSQLGCGLRKSRIQ